MRGDVGRGGSATVQDSVSRARGLRRTQTRAETTLWHVLRARRHAGFKFRRQVPIGPYVTDFLCYATRIVIELDGAPHADAAQRAHDARRDAWLRAQGFRVLRFSNDLVLGGSTALLLAALDAALDPSSGLR